MRQLLLVSLVLAIVMPAIAGQNPGIQIALDADPPNGVRRVDPAASSVFDVYVVLDRFGAGDAGVRGTAFRFERTFSGFKMQQEGLLGGLVLGNVEGDGWSVQAGSDCVYPDPESGIVVVGRVQYLYTGTPGTITMQPHSSSGRLVQDCNYDLDEYCIFANLGVWTDAPAGEPDCGRNPDVAIAVHVDDTIVPGCEYALSDCGEIVTSWFSDEVVIYVVICDFPKGFTGVEYSMVYDPGWDSYVWEDCSDFCSDPFDGSSGDGIIQWWDTPQLPSGPGGGLQVIAIHLLRAYPEHPGRAYIEAHPITGVAGVYNSYEPPIVDVVLPWDTVGNGRAGWIDCWGGEGCNPCLCVNPDPCWPEDGTEITETTWDGTWSVIKSMYR